MIKNKNGFTLMEMFLVLAILGIVTLQVPQLFSANSAMTSYFEVQNLLDRTHNAALQSLQNKKALLKRLTELHMDELARCIKQVNPDNNCAQFDMLTPATLVWPGSVLNSKHSLQSGECISNCVIEVKTSYRISCRSSSCNSIEFLIATTKITTKAQILNRIIEHKDAVLMGKNQFADSLTENMRCNDANKGFMFGFNYLSRTNTCRDCGSGAAPCFSPSGGYENSGVTKNVLKVDPTSIVLSEEIPEKIALKFEIQQASNNILGKVSLTCNAGSKTVGLSNQQTSLMMSSLRKDNQYQASWEIPIEDVRSGPQAFRLSCSLKAYDYSGTYLISMSSAELMVYATEAQRAAAIAGGGGGSSGGSTGTGTGGGGFTVPSYSCP